MKRLRYETEFGEGWIVYHGARLETVTLPGGPAPAAGEEEFPPPAVADIADALESFFAGEGEWAGRPELADAAGRTQFERDVYRTVAAIPAGETRSYGEVAAAAGRPGAARAVGAAMARNPFPPLIPCHRVVAADGRLGGYGGGLALKKALLRIEGWRA
ncbi:MAG: methylated-DNA--[protein]-cysteine S-methyltransferase [Acidimicrobiia bacterium]